MEPISAELVEKTWKEFATFPLEKAQTEAANISKTQPNLVAFMMEFTQELSQEVKELAIYMFYVLYRMFQRISAEEIITSYEKNEHFIKSLEGVHDKFFERIAGVQLSGQPYVMKYVVETLIEAPEDEEPVALTEEDMGYLFLLLKTVVDLLDQRMRFDLKEK